MPDSEAEFFEAVFGGVANINEWFGENAFITRCSKYDDLANGADYVIEWDVDGEMVRLKLDLTITRDQEKFNEKLDEMLKNAQQGDLGKVKYFKGEHLEEVGQLKDVPEAVIHAKRDEIHSLAYDLLAKKNMDEHYLRGEFLKTIRDQLYILADYVQLSSFKATKVVAAYKKVIDVIEPLIEASQYEKFSGKNPSPFRDGFRDKAKPLLNMNFFK